MSKRKRGDDADQELLPLPGVERVAPTGTITSSPKPSLTVNITPPVASVPIIPASTDVPVVRRLEAHGAWVFGRGMHLKILSVGDRSWREFLAWETARAVIWYVVAPALLRRPTARAALRRQRTAGRPSPGQTSARCDRQPRVGEREKWDTHPEKHHQKERRK